MHREEEGAGPRKLQQLRDVGRGGQREKRQREGGKQNVYLSCMSQICSSWQNQHHAVAFQNESVHLSKEADLKSPQRKQTQADGWGT